MQWYGQRRPSPPFDEAQAAFAVGVAIWLIFLVRRILRPEKAQ